LYNIPPYFYFIMISGSRILAKLTNSRTLYE
jgi:hypothetical protein